jgi:PAS domain S-box-containing protein
MSGESHATDPAGADDLPALRALVEGTAASTGDAFFRNLVRHLAWAVGAEYAFIGEFTDIRSRVRTLAYWALDRIVDNIEFDLAGTPCEEVVKGPLCHFPTRVKERFPRDRPLAQMGIESYLGVPLCDAAGEVLGHLAVFDRLPMPAEPRRLYTFRVFAARAAAELERLRVEQRLRQSEQRYRDLYEEAPIGYLAIGADGRFRTANRRAAEWLGCPVHALTDSPFADVLADGAAGKTRGRECLAKLNAGQEIQGEELELRTGDGRPLWVSLWAKPSRDSAGRVQASRCIWVNITDRVLAEAERARLQQQNLYLQEEIKDVHNFEEIIGRSPALVTVLDKVRSVAPTDASVLVFGDTGTGKELVARAIHFASRRRDRPLIKVNCAALPAGLVESELFGHEKGAFTGALARRLGRFELAHGGTLFLDEVGDIPPEAQAKLLRVLQEREVERVGGSGPFQVDVRVIAATNRDLARAVREKTFREDLYYRLNVFPISLPPLRERREDLPLLVHFLLTRFTARVGKHLDGVSPATMQRLLAYPWPGNVRELENVLERAVILAAGPVLEIDADTLAPSGQALPAKQTQSLEEVERGHIQAVLDRTGGVIDGPRGAAKILDLHPNTLRSRMKKLGIARTTHEIS